MQRFILFAITYKADNQSQIIQQEIVMEDNTKLERLENFVTYVRFVRRILLHKVQANDIYQAIGLFLPPECEV